MRFRPRIFLFSEASSPILPAVCTHCFQRNIGYPSPHTLYCFTDLLKAMCTSAAQSAWPRCDDLGGRRAGQEKRKYFPVIAATFHWGMAPPILAVDLGALSSRAFAGPSNLPMWLSHIGYLVITDMLWSSQIPRSCRQILACLCLPSHTYYLPVKSCCACPPVNLKVPTLDWTM